MQRSILQLLVFFVASMGFFLVLTSMNVASAATPGEEKVFEDIMVEHSDSRYTHRLPNVKANLILKPQFDDWTSSKVRVKVEYTKATKFKVLSIELLEKHQDSPNEPDIGDALSSFKGRLTLSPVEGRDYRIITPMNNLFIDFSPPLNFNYLLGKEVELTYTGTKENPVFKDLREISKE